MSDAPEILSLHLDGFDGPLDLLLDLARSQKVDLARISILSLVEQYLAVIEGARRVRLRATLIANQMIMTSVTSIAVPCAAPAMRVCEMLCAQGEPANAAARRGSMREKASLMAPPTSI